MAQNNQMVSSAHSDDGNLRERSRTDDLSNQRVTMHNVPAEHDIDGVASITANFSEHRVRLQERPDEDDAEAILEMPYEDEHASSPPDSLSHKDVVSEHIASRQVHKFGRVDKAQSVFRDHLSDAVSKEVHESQAAAPHKLVPEAQVSARVELVETSRSI